MKIAFLHSKNEFTDQLFSRLRDTLPEHDLVSWETGSGAPATDIEVLLASGSVGRAELTDQRKMLLVQTTSTGYETIDLEAASQLGIWVSYAPSDLTGNATSVAEFAVLLLLGASRDLQETLRSVQGPTLPAPRIHRALNGKTVCIIGLGNIGSQLVDRLRPFGVLLIATDEHPENAPPGVVAFRPEQLLSAVSDADYVVVCARASKANENLIDKTVIRGMKPGSILINIARGTLIDEHELLLALECGHISAIGCDVVRDEPLSSSNAFLKSTQALLTPHIAAFTDLMLEGTVSFVAKVIQDLSGGKLPHSLLNRPDRPRNNLDYNER
jgi:phosphoglycerate dehydrogenase-like enzyme